MSECELVSILNGAKKDNKRCNNNTRPTAIKKKKKKTNQLVQKKEDTLLPHYLTINMLYSDSYAVLLFIQAMGSTVLVGIRVRISS